MVIAPVGMYFVLVVVNDNLNASVPLDFLNLHGFINITQKSGWKTCWNIRSIACRTDMHE